MLYISTVIGTVVFCPSKLTQKEIEERISKKTNNEYILVGKYLGINTPTKIKHETCGTTYMASPSYILKGQNLCPNKKCIEARKDPNKYKKMF